MAGIVILSIRRVLRVPVGEHPCYPLHSSLKGGTRKKHVHGETPGRPCAAA